jgi:hypothetical protein
MPLKREFFIGSDFWVSFAGPQEDLKSNLNAFQDIIIIIYLQTITYLLFKIDFYSMRATIRLP